jgi:hypothetical protein
MCQPYLEPKSDCRYVLAPAGLRQQKLLLDLYVASPTTITYQSNTAPDVLDIVVVKESVTRVHLLYALHSP